MKRKIISIVGARPQFIKLAPLSSVLRKEFKEIVVHTGQHYDYNMSQSFFEDLEIPYPDYFLEVGSGNHGVQTGEMLIKIEQVLLKEKPDLVIVFGDTNSTLAGALAASKQLVKTIHIEAGLRSFNKVMPEEINRVVADHVSDLLFAPTHTAMANLEAENLLHKSYNTGDIMVDSLNRAVERSKLSNIIDKLSLNNTDFYLLTLHRPYNVDNSSTLAGILTELGKISVKIIFPTHPRTMKIITDNNIQIPFNVLTIEPAGYFDFIALQKHSQKIITDSGGVQKESYILQKPCITLRSETEWIETVSSGWNLLINPVEEIDYSKKIEEFWPVTKHQMLFGENVAYRMFEIIKNGGL